MGQLSFANGRYLGSGIRDRVARAAVPHYRHLRRLVRCLRVPAKLGFARALAIRNFANYRPHVSALHLFHDYRSEDDRSFQARAMPGGISDRGSGNWAALFPERVRSLLRAVYRGSYRQFVRDVDGLAAENGICHGAYGRMNVKYSTI